MKLELSDNEKRIILKALNKLRNYLSEQECSTNSIDEIFIKVNKPHELKLDILDTKIIINSLNTMRDDLKKRNEPRNEINDIILKIINETDKKTIYKENERQWITIKNQKLL